MSEIDKTKQIWGRENKACTEHVLHKEKRTYLRQIKNIVYKSYQSQRRLFSMYIKRDELEKWNNIKLRFHHDDKLQKK